MSNPAGLVYFKNEDTNTPIVALADNMGQLHVLLATDISGESQELLVDPLTGALAIITTPHYKAHQGEMFQVSYKSPDASPIVDNANIEIFLIISATKEAHVTFAISAGGDAELEVRESVSVVANGTALAETNMRRRSAIAAEVQAFHTPNILGEGTRFVNFFLPGGTGGNSAGGLLRADTEWLFAPSRTYLVRGINRAGNAQPMSLLVQWYEKTP